MFLVACDSNQVNFTGIKVFDDQFNVALETKEKQRIKELKALFNDKAEYKEIAPNFKYLIEFNTSNGSERWKYSIDGYTQKHSQEDLRIYALFNKDQFNELAKVN